METKTVENIKNKLKEVEALKESAKTGFLATISDAMGQLGELGFPYRLEAVEEAPEGKNGHNRCSACGAAGHSKRTCPKGGQNGVVQ